MNGWNRRALVLGVAGWLMAGGAGLAKDVRLGRIPEVVLSSVEEVVPGMVIDEASVEEEDDGTRYEIHGTVGSAEIEAVVREDGTILKLKMGGSYVPVDTDGDGIDDLTERRVGLDPYDADTDGDFYPDGFEIARRSNPDDAASVPEILRLRPDVRAGVIVVEVSTFSGAEFVVEQCGGDFVSWSRFGKTIVGDGGVVQIPVPDTGEIPECYFRVRVVAAAGGVPGVPVAGGGNVPASLEGYDVVIERDDEEEVRLCFINGAYGEEVEEEGDDIEFTAFGYRVRQTGENTLRVTLVFTTSDGYETEDYDLTFDADGNGTYSSTKTESGESEDSERGNFTAQNHP